MRKTYALFLAIVFLSTASYGQEQDSSKISFRPIGVSLGVIPHMSTVVNDQFDYQWDLNNIIAGGITLPFGKNLALTGDIQLMHTGATTNIAPNPLEAEVVSDVDVRDRFGYLAVSAGLRYFFTDRFYIGGYAGPAIHLYTERLTTKNYTSGFAQEERRKFDFGNGDVRELQWIVNLGIGYELPIGDFIGIVIEPTAYYGLNKIDNNSNFNGRAVGVGLRTAVLFKRFKRNVHFTEIPEDHKASYIQKKRREKRKEERMKKNETEGEETNSSGNGSM